MMSRRSILLPGLFALVLTLSCGESENSMFFSEQKPAWQQVEPEALTGAEDEAAPDINARTYLAAGMMFEEKGNIPHAILNYNRAITVDPEYAEALNCFGMLLGRIGKHDESLKMLRRAMALRPDSPVLYNNIGYQYCLQGRWVEAEDMLRKSIELDPGYERARINLGMALCRMGSFDEGLREFEKVLDQPDAYYNLGLMYKADRDYPHAVEAFRLALTMEPKMTAASKQMEQLEEKLKAGVTKRVTEDEDEIVVTSIVGTQPVDSAPQMYGPTWVEREKSQQVAEAQPQARDTIALNEQAEPEPVLEENGMSMALPEDLDIVDNKEPSLEAVVKESNDSAAPVLEMKQPESQLEVPALEKTVVAVADNSYEIDEQPVEVSIQVEEYLYELVDGYAIMESPIPPIWIASTVDEENHTVPEPEPVDEKIEVAELVEPDPVEVRIDPVIINFARHAMICRVTDACDAFNSFRAWQSLQPKASKDTLQWQVPVDPEQLSNILVSGDAEWILAATSQMGPLVEVSPTNDVVMVEESVDRITPEEFWAAITGPDLESIMADNVYAMDINTFTVPVLDGNGIRFLPLAVWNETAVADVPEKAMEELGKPTRMPLEIMFPVHTRKVGGYEDKTLEPVDLSDLVASAE